MIFNRFSFFLALCTIWYSMVIEGVSAYYPKTDMSGVNPVSVTHEEIDNAMQIYGIIPDVLASAPPFFAKITFANRVCPRIGQKVEAHQMRFFPQKMEWPGRAEDHYCVVVVDPDVPSRSAHYEREFIHWMVVNIKGPVMMSRETIIDWLGPEPLIGTGVHRYIFLVFLQPGLLEFDEQHLKALRGDSRRGSFSSRYFAKHYNMEPFAINFVLAEWVARSSYFNSSHPWNNRRHGRSIVS